MENLRKFRKEKGVSQQNIADAVNVSRVSISQYETGVREPSLEILKNIADYLNVTVDQLMGRDDSAPNPEKPKQHRSVKSSSHTYRIPVVGSFRCGYNGNGEEFLQYDDIEITDELHNRYGDGLLAGYAVGKSMIPTIHPGDLIYAIPNAPWKDNDIVVLVVNDAEMIKRLRHTSDGGIDILSDNERYPTTHLTPQDLTEQDVSILARIVRVERDL